MSRQIMTLFFFNIMLSAARSEHEGSHKKDLITALEKKIDVKIIEYANNIFKWLDNINYNYLNTSYSSKFKEITSKQDSVGNEARGMKMISLALIPIIFHIGMTSTWIILTAFLAAKSVAIGLILLAFKIVVSSVKIASFITAWKIKKHHSEPWPVHYDHHAIHNDHHSYASEHGAHHSYTPDYSSHHTHTPDHTHYTHSSDFNNHNSYKPDWGSHLTPYKVNPPGLIEMEYVESKKVDKKLG